MSTLALTGCRLADDFVRTHPPLSDQWEHEHGVLLRGLMDLYDATGKQAYLDFALNSLDPLIDADGNIQGYRMDRYEMDDIISGRAVLSLYRHTGDEKYKKAAQLLRRQFDTHPRASFGNFLHKKTFPDILFIDSIYMGMPFLAEYETLLGDGDVQTALDNIFTAYRYNHKPDTGLMIHGYDAKRTEIWANPETGNSATYWGRGMGWYTVGLIEVLDYVPEDDARRPEALRMLTGLLRSVLHYQDADGVWHQVLDQAGHPGNYPEASASAMFTYALIKAVNKGYLSPFFAKDARRAWQGLLKTFVVERDGHLVLTGTCASGGLGVKDYRDGSFDSYACEATRDNDLKGVGVLMMATAQIDKLPKE